MTKESLIQWLPGLVLLGVFVWKFITHTSRRNGDSGGGGSHYDSDSDGGDCGGDGGGGD